WRLAAAERGGPAGQRRSAPDATRCQRPARLSGRRGPTPPVSREVRSPTPTIVPGMLRAPTATGHSDGKSIWDRGGRAGSAGDVTNASEASSTRQSAGAVPGGMGAGSPERARIEQTRYDTPLE